MIIIKQRSLDQFWMTYYGMKDFGCGVQNPRDALLIPSAATNVGDKFRFEWGEDDQCSDTEHWIEYEVVAYDSLNNQFKEVEKDINYKK